MAEKDKTEKKIKSIQSIQQLKGRVSELTQLNKQLKQKLTLNQKRLKREFDKNKKFIDISTSLIVALDVDGKVCLVNKKGCEILGFDRDKIIGKKWFDNFLPADIRDNTKEVFEKIIDGGIIQSEYFQNPVLTSSGKRKIISWHNSVLKNSKGEIDMVFCSGKDVTELIRTDAKFQFEHQMLERLINGLPDMVFIKNNLGIYTMANNAFAKIVGLEDSGCLIGKNVFDVFPEDAAKIIDSDEKEILEKGTEQIDRELVLEDFQGRSIWLSKTMLPLKDEKGNVTDIIGIARDITESKRLNEQLESANQQLQASEQQLKAANQQLQASEQQLRASNQQIQASEQQLRASNQQLSASEQQLRAANQQLDASNQQLKASEQELARSNRNLKIRSNELECLYSLSRLADDRSNSLMKIFTGMLKLIKDAWEYPDITEVRIIYNNQEYKTAGFTEAAWMQSADIRVFSKKSGKIQVCYLQDRPAVAEGPFSKEERKLLNTIAEHIGEIAERKQAEKSREKVIEQLKQKNTELERFTYAVSHDLKSPLITIKGFIGMLEKDIQQEDSEQMSTDMQRIAKAADKMSLLLDELLDLSRIGRGARQAEKINLTDIANEAVDIVAGQITKHGVDVKISDNLPVAFANRAQILTVFQNLLDNAVKFCSSAENPFVEIGSFEQNNEQICFVRDNGIGLDKKHFDKIFGLFDKLDNKTEGTGVGLALVKRIIEVHSGRIWVESDGNNQGSIFCFTIPAYSKTRK